MLPAHPRKRQEVDMTKSAKVEIRRSGQGEVIAFINLPRRKPKPRKTFTVAVERIYKVYQTASFDIKAASQAEAEELAQHCLDEQNVGAFAESLDWEERPDDIDD